MKKKTIKLQMYQPTALHISCVNLPSQVKAYMKNDNPAEMVNGFFYWSGTEFYIVIHNKTTPGEIAHEVAHFLNTVYRVIGQKYDLENDEMYCYLMAYFITEILNLQKKNK
jgi:hypothetical protein